MQANFGLMERRVFVTGSAAVFVVVLVVVVATVDATVAGRAPRVLGPARGVVTAAVA